MPMTEVRGVDVERVSAWLAANIAGARAPFTFDLIAGGRSNLTFRVTGADGTVYVLRRPPGGGSGQSWRVSDAGSWGSISPIAPR